MLPPRPLLSCFSFRSSPVASLQGEDKGCLGLIGHSKPGCGPLDSIYLDEPVSRSLGGMPAGHRDGSSSSVGASDNSADSSHAPSLI